MTHPAETTRNILWLVRGSIRFVRDVPIDQVDYELEAIRKLGYEPWVECVPFSQRSEPAYNTDWDAIVEGGAL